MPKFLHHMQERGLIRVILSPQNLGVAKACNQGARAARGEFLVFLNNDTVVTPGWLQELVSSARENPRVATVGAKLLYPDDTVQHAGVTINDERKFFHLYEYFHKDHPASQCLTAACLLVKNEKFFQLGGFDEQFHYGWEDMDLCPRFRKQDWQFLYNPRSVIYHLESKTPGRFNKEAENSELLFSRWHHLMVPDTDHYFRKDGIMRPPNYDYTQGGNRGQGRQKVSEARKVVLTLRRQEKGRFPEEPAFCLSLRLCALARDSKGFLT